MNIYNKYIKMRKNKLHGMYESYYYSKNASHYSMLLLGNLVSYLRITHKNYDQIVQELYNKKYIYCADDLNGYGAYYNSTLNIIEISADYAFDSQEDAENLAREFPDITTKNAFIYTFFLSLNDFLNLVNQVINFFNENKEFIIIYEDNQGKLHLKEYHPTSEELQNWRSF